jgi:hypothetical protein
MVSNINKSRFRVLGLIESLKICYYFGFLWTTRGTLAVVWDTCYLTS